MSSISDDLCSGFEPQGYQSDRCKKCFRLKSKHGLARPVLRRMSWREKVYGTSAVPPQTIPEREATDTFTSPSSTTQEDQANTSSQPSSPRSVRSTRSGSQGGGARSRTRSDDEMSFKSALSGGDNTLPLSQATSCESLTSNDARSMATAVSGGSTPNSARSTPTDHLHEGDTRTSVRSIRAQLETMETKCGQLAEENARLRQSSTSALDSDDDGNNKTQTMEERLSLSESLCQDYKEENAVLKCELREFQESVSKGSSEEAGQLTDKLTAAESLCEELMEENEALKREVTELQQEIEELQDQYREEEIEEFRDLQRDLEQTAKNCRVLQFKLRKAERVKDQAEADRQHLELQLKELPLNNGVLGVGSASSPSTISSDVMVQRRVRELESELKVAKEVSVRLHNELETAEDKRCKLEDENFLLKEKARELETRTKLVELSRQKTDLKRRGNGEKDSSGSPTFVAKLRQTTSPLDTTTASGSSLDRQQYNVAQLLRDLQDAVERETDIKDQLKFAEDDLVALRGKVQDLETDNEGLLRQLTKMSAAPNTTRTRPPMIRSASEGQAQIQLELAEHEVTVLKSKLQKSEKDNERLLAHAALLEGEIKKVGGSSRMVFTETEYAAAALPDAYYKQKIKILEDEIDELKLKLQEYKMQAEFDKEMSTSWRMGTNRGGPRVRSAAASSAMTRSRSLDTASVLAESPTGEKPPSGDAHSPTTATTTTAAPHQSFDLKRQLAVAEQEVTVLRKRIHELDSKAERLTEENKKLQVVKKGGTDQQSRVERMERDIGRFTTKIGELEKEREELLDENEKLNRLHSDTRSRNASALQAERQRWTDEAQESKTLASDLKAEKERCKHLDSQLADYKQIIARSDNQKLVSMASKVEVLTGQLKESEERYSAMHRRFLPTDSTADGQYADALKERIEQLEKDLSEARVKKNQWSVSSKASTSELNECYEVLAIIEAQVERVYDQLQRLEETSARRQHTPPTATATTPTDPDRKPPADPKPPNEKATSSTGLSTVRRGGGIGARGLYSSDSSESPTRILSKQQILADVGRVKSQLEMLMSRMNGRTDATAAAAADTGASSATRGLSDSELVQTLQEKCDRQDKTISEMRQQLQSERSEKERSQQQCTAATHRLLQTEERWNKELERLRDSYEGQLKDLKFYLQEAERGKEEKTELLTARTESLNEKTRLVCELEQKVGRLQEELRLKYKDLQERCDVERRKAKEFETKYQKLEELFENERRKLTSEREKYKTDLSELKRRYDDTKADAEKLRKSWEKKQTLWESDRERLDSRIKVLEKETADKEQQAQQKAEEIAGEETKKCMEQLKQLRSESEASVEKHKSEKTAFLKKIADAEKRSEEMEKMQKDNQLLNSRITEQRLQLEEARRLRDEAQAGLNNGKQNWKKEKDQLVHKQRQEDKIQQAEVQAMQLKFESRIKIMEDTSKSLHSQLAQVRRERDQTRESLQNAERRFAEIEQKYEGDLKAARKRLETAMKKAENHEEILAMAEKLKRERQQLTDNHEADRRIWNLEKDKITSRNTKLEKGSSKTKGDSKHIVAADESSTNERRLTDALGIADELRERIRKLTSEHETEMENTKRRFDDAKDRLSKENTDLKKKIKELQDTIKVQEIDRRNVLSTKEGLDVERILIESERDALLQRMNDAQIHQLANKYKLDSVADLLREIEARVRGEECAETLAKATRQLTTVRDDMGKARELNRALDTDNGDTGSLHSWKSRQKGEPLSGNSSPSQPGRTTRMLSRLSSDNGEPTRLSISSSVQKSPSWREQPTTSDVAAKRKLLAVSKESSLASTTRSFGGGPESGASGGLSFVPGGSWKTTRSLSTETSASSISNWQERIAELRALRSPSPSPRKTTVYPEPPPSILIDLSKTVEYDKEGKRHYIPRTLPRSISYEPTSSSYTLGQSLHTTTADTLGAPHDIMRSSSAASHQSTDSEMIAHPPKKEGKGIRQFLRSLSKERSSHDDSDSRQSTESGIRERRSIFGLRKSRSVESTDIGQKIGNMGLRTTAPAISPSTWLPNEEDTEERTDATDRRRRPEQRQSAGSRFIEKVRRSLSRGRDRKASKEQNADTSVTPKSTTDNQPSQPKTAGTVSASTSQRKEQPGTSTTVRSGVGTRAYRPAKKSATISSLGAKFEKNPSPTLVQSGYGIGGFPSKEPLQGDRPSSARKTNERQTDAGLIRSALHRHSATTTIPQRNVIDRKLSPNTTDATVVRLRGTRVSSSTTSGGSSTSSYSNPLSFFRRYTPFRRSTHY